MAIPFKVNLRSLFIRRVSTLTTIACLALVVGVFSAMMALANGLEHTFRTTGDPLNVLVLRAGSTAETNSGISVDQFQILKSLPGVATRPGGGPVATGEVVTIINQSKRGTKDGANVVLRGVPPEAFEAHPEVKVVEGRGFQPGKSELIASRSIAAKFEGCRLGETLTLRKRAFTIVGLFDASGTARGSEIWGDVDEVNDTFKRTGYYSSVLLRASDPSAVETIKAAITGDQRLKLDALKETEYFARQTRQSEPIKWSGRFLAAILAIGAAFGAANTMYAAVSSRSKEIGTLRAIGFSRWSVLVAYVGEALVLGVLGGIAGIAGLYGYLALFGGETGTANWATFSEVSFAFRVTPVLVGVAIAFSSIIGALGGLLPARFAARAPITTALRQL